MQIAYNLYIGRFQPPHLGHQTIFEDSLNKNEPICIAIRDIEPDEKNPLSAQQVMKLWKKIYKNNPLVEIIIIPDIKSIKYGRNVGYGVEEIIVPGNIASISATQIRNNLKESDDNWKQMVNPIIWKDVQKLLK